VFTIPQLSPILDYNLKINVNRTLKKTLCIKKIEESLSQVKNILLLKVINVIDVRERACVQERDLFCNIFLKRFNFVKTNRRTISKIRIC